MYVLRHRSSLESEPALCKKAVVSGGYFADRQSFLLELLISQESFTNFYSFLKMFTKKYCIFSLFAISLNG